MKKPTWKLKAADCFEVAAKLKPGKIAAVISSPPYPGKAARYEVDIGHDWSLAGWAGTMTKLTHLLLEKSDWVVWVVADTVNKGREYPSTDELRVNLHKAGVICETPGIWWKNSPPSRMLPGGKQSHWVPTYERCLAFRSDTAEFNWEENGTAKKYKTGGNFSQRNSKGKRVAGSAYPKGEYSRPRNFWPFAETADNAAGLFQATVGGGQMGLDGPDSRLVTSGGRAPFPLMLAYQLVLAYTQEGQHVFDPFAGTSNTIAAALLANRSGYGVDVDEAQIMVSRERLERFSGNLPAFQKQMREKHDQRRNT